METSRPLAIDSFSYSWLSNVKPPLDGIEESLRESLDSAHEAISKEMACMTVKSKRFVPEAQNFNFDIPISPSPAALLHADELFSDGLVKPVFVSPSNIEASSCTSDLSNSYSFSSRNFVVTASEHHSHVLKKWKKSSKKIMQKCFGYVRPRCYRVGSSRKSNRVDDIDRRVREAKSWSKSPETFLQQNTTHRVSESCSDIENSIYEAVLHCKRSIGL